MKKEIEKLNNKNNNLPKGWRKVKLGEFLEINPSVKLERGKEYPYIDMADVQPFSQISQWSKLKVFRGSGSKFEDGDTIFARITPCLENGKIAYIKNLNGPGFGSTEFFVLRGKNGISDSRFVYYLSLTHKVRKLAEQSMIGASGRQRVEREAFEQIEVVIPEDINEQKRIADILSSFDDKIELNNKIIKTLEEMAQEVFKEWFVRFRFPGWQKVKFVNSELGKIPDGWEVGYLGDEIYSEIIKPKVKKFEGEKIYLATADVEKNEIVNEKTKISYNNRPIRANMEPVLNSIWFAKMINTYKVLFFFEGNKEDIERYILSTGFMGIYALKNMQYYLYLFINSKEFHQIKDTLVQGAVQEAITNTNVKQIKFLIPPVNLLDEFNKKVEPLLIKAYKLKKENQTLAALRELLLPKLISGEIRV